MNSADAGVAAEPANVSPAIRPTPPGINSVSFMALLVVQFTAALNDNAFRWLVVPIVKPLIGDALALAVGLAGFTLPFLVFASPAGFLAERFSKAKVISAFRLVEAIVLGIGLLAVLTQNPLLLFGIVFATGALAALFAPSKVGSLPEIVHDSELSTANGWMALMVVVPASFGFLAGNLLVELVQPVPSGPIEKQGLMLAAACIMTTALVGWGASLLIIRVPAVNPQHAWTWNWPRETWQDLKLLFSERLVCLTAMGIAFFWMMAALAQINVDTFGTLDLGLSQAHIGFLGMMLVLGLGLGSLMAGWISAGRIELGLVPIGAAGMALASILLFVCGQYGVSHPEEAFYASCIALLGLGTAAGLFDVPLEAYLQHSSPPRRLGSIIAATNFVVFSGILLVSGLFYILQGVMKMSAGGIFLLAGLATIPVGIYIATLMPATMLRMLAWILSRCAYRLDIRGLNHIPREGGALLAPNHVTWIDGILLLVTVPRPVRYIIYADFVHHPRLVWLAKIFNVIPIRAGAGPKALMQSILQAREALSNGECVCIFPEGTLTRSGQMQTFQPGFLKILQGTGCPVIPVCLHGLWGSIFSYRDGKFFWKWPRAWRYPVSMSFGEPVFDPKSAEEISHRVRELGMTIVKELKDRELNPQRAFLRACRRRKNHCKVADSTGVELTGGKLLAGSLAMEELLRTRYLKRDEKFVGILLPPTVGCALANMAASLSRRVTVNLNYTMSEEDLRYCVREAGVKHVITSRKMLEKKPLDLGVEWIFLEDLRSQVKGLVKLRAALGAYVLPLAWVERRLGLTSIRADDPITVIFSSGSTGQPKGVVLSHHNIRATVDAADQVFQIDENDTVLGIIPLFHSFGYLTTMWLPLCLSPKVVYHINPLDGRVIGELAEKHKTKILFATPTFLRTYLKRCTPQQFATLDLVVVGAEKLPRDLADQFHEKYGRYPTEGYGATETSGPTSVNIPDHRCEMVEQRGTKLGSVGRPLPDTLARAVDVQTRVPLPVGAEGLIEIKGYNVMLGYLNQPEKTAEVLKDGWYNTGDMGFIDNDGFLHITGRISRFSKIGGEMVPHIRIEECLLKITESVDSEDAGPLLAVTAVTDPKKGERLIVLHRPLPKPIPTILNELATFGLPNLWMPSADGFIQVESIPVLGTGKMDLRGLKKLAEDLATAPKLINSPAV